MTGVEASLHKIGRRSQSSAALTGKKKNNKKKNNNNTADREIEVFFGARLIAVQGHIDPRLLLPRARCAGKSVKRPGKSPLAVSNCSNLCDSVCSLSAYLHKRALSSSLSQYSAARPASERYRATAHVGYSCPALASASNDQAAKAAMSVLERVENYSENLTLVYLGVIERGYALNSDADHPVSMAWRSL